MRRPQLAFVGFFFTLAAMNLAAANEPFDPVAAGELPQYIFFNKSPTARGPLAWRQSRPASFTAESCREIVETIGARGDDRLRIGVHFPFSILEDDADTLTESLRRLLTAAQEADVPVLITLDGQNWWESRRDLWNWWDPDLPGFDPHNRLNVEWTGWGPEHAVKIGWRNWGRQIRVRPAPNLASPRFLDEHWRRYDVLIPVIVEWYRALPANRKYLFGGVKIGWEASINVNAYHHADGNRIFEQHPTDPSDDPRDHDMAKGWTFGNAPLGYAAVYTSGFKRSGELTKEDVERVVHEYLRRCSEEANRRGLPTHLLFTHQGGTYPPWDKHLSFKPAVNEFSIPGWSFYTHEPAECGSLARDLSDAGREQWAASEWWRAARDTAGWRAHFQQALAFRRCRLITVYNWEPFQKDANAIEAVCALLDASHERESSTPEKRPALDRAQSQ